MAHLDCIITICFAMFVCSKKKQSKQQNAKALNRALTLTAMTETDLSEGFDTRGHVEGEATQFALLCVSGFDPSLEALLVHPLHAATAVARAYQRLRVFGHAVAYPAHVTCIT